MPNNKQNEDEARRAADQAAELEMKNTPVQITVEMTLLQLHDNLVAAIEGGTGYWARVELGKHQPGWRNYLAAVFVVTEESDEKKGAIRGNRYELTIDKLKKGATVLANSKEYAHHFRDIVMDQGDATTGDVLVQCALFGDIVYG